MTKKIFHVFIILSVLCSSISHAQAAPSYRNDPTGTPTSPEDRSLEAYEEQEEIANSDPRYYISLRWLVYMLILSLPISASQTPSGTWPPPSNSTGRRPAGL